MLNGIKVQDLVISKELRIGKRHGSSTGLRVWGDSGVTICGLGCRLGNEGMHPNPLTPNPKRGLGFRALYDLSTP